MKYVLWKVSNGWLMTQSNTIWEDANHMINYAVFHSLKEFSDFVDPKPQRKPQPRIHGKFASKPTNRITEHAGRTSSRN